MLPVRLEEKIAKQDNGCWLWTAAKNNQGYGVTTTGWKRLKTHKRALAHRKIYEELIGPIPEGLELDHLCRTPLCVNPEHLEPVTHEENMRRGIRAVREFCVNGHPRTPENTYTRKDRPNATQCIPCNSEKNRRRYKPTGNPQNAIKTHCKRGHEFTLENTYLLRGGTARQCKICTAMHTKISHSKHKGGTKHG